MTDESREVTDWQRNGYLVSDDPARLDLDLIHRFLAEKSYWAEGRPREVVERSIANSINLGLYEDDRQLGLARVITDRATFAWVCDVFILPEARGKDSGHG